MKPKINWRRVWKELDNYYKSRMVSWKSARRKVRQLVEKELKG